MPNLDPSPTSSAEVTVAEAAAIIGIGPRSVSRAIRDGRLIPSRKLPGRTGAYLIPLDEVRKYAALGGQKASA